MGSSSVIVSFYDDPLSRRYQHHLGLAGLSGDPRSEKATFPLYSHESRYGGSGCMRAIGLPRVTATVLDASGMVKAVAKGDLAPPHTLDSSRGKAYDAVSLGPNFSENTTSAIVARVVNGPAFGPLQHLPGVFLVAGGVVIKSNDEVIGVGGAPGGDKDEVCAQAAVAKIIDRLR